MQKTQERPPRPAPNDQEPPTIVEPADTVDGGFQQLDSRVIRVWQLESALVAGALCFALLIGGSLVGALTPVPWPAILAIWTLATCFFTVSVFWLPARQFARWSFRLHESTLELRYGIMWHVSVLIPVSRLQHVDLHRDPFERYHGLATLEVHTAGTRDASHRVPGLDIEVAKRLRDQLVASADLVIP